MPVRATTTFHAGRRIVCEGDELPDGDPIVKGREGLFERVESDEPVTAHECDVCGKRTKTAAGLSAHKRSHAED